MFTTDIHSSVPFHYISASVSNSQYSLILDIEKTQGEIFSFRRKLSATFFSNSMVGNIRSIECDQAMEITRNVRKLSIGLSRKLNSIDKVQFLSKSPYYKILMYLYSASDKSCILDELIKQFRPICTDSTGQQRASFIKIQKEIIIFVRTCEQIETETEVFIDTMLLRTE